MSYENPNTPSFSFSGVNFATTSTRKIRLPKGKQAKVLDAVLSATVLFTNTTTAGRLQLGVVGTPARFLDMPLGVTAAGETLAATNVVNAIKDDTIPQDVDLLVTFVAPTGGTPAGVGDINLSIATF